MDIQNKRIVITGAASGIGRALVLELTQADGVRLVAADINAGGLARLEADVRQAHLHIFTTDLSTEAGTDALFAYAVAVMGGIDIFIANAGFTYYEALTRADWQHMQRLFAVNVYSPIYSAVQMRQLNPATPHLTVITSSTQAHWGLAGFALYGSAKSALHRFADAYRSELAPHERVMMVYPVATETGFFDAASIPASVRQLTGTQSAETVAKAIMRGIHHNSDAVYPSRRWTLVTALEHFLPVFQRYIQAAYRRAFFQWRTTQKG